MKRERMNRHVMRHAIKSAAAGVMALALVFQPCFTISAQADMSAYGYYDYYLGTGYDSRRLISSTKNYDDGTKATTQYQYDEQGNVIYCKDTEPDGSWYTVERIYDGNTRLKETIRDYDAYTGTDSTIITEIRDDGTYDLAVTKWKDGSTDSRESWYDNRGNNIKRIYTSSNGNSYQANSVFDQQDNLLETATTYSDGSVTTIKYQYDESGRVTHYRVYAQDSATGKQLHEESSYTMDGDKTNTYSVKKEITENGESTWESWHSVGSTENYTEKYTHWDGSQTVDEYIYDTYGQELYYSSTSSDGSTKKRETTTTEDGYKQVESDSKGNSEVTLYSYDRVSERQTREVTRKNEDGSSSYRKMVFNNNYDIEVYILRDISAEGQETYEENYLEQDGGVTIKLKTEDGVTTVTRTDAAGNYLTSQETLPDGTKSETAWERREDGQPVNEVKLYTDGSVDRIDYEYNENGKEIKRTELRKNGVGAVTMTEYSGANDEVITETAAYNNGFQMVTTLNTLDGDSYQLTSTYSGGDVAQHIFSETTWEKCSLKTIYRDGRVEEKSTQESDENWYEMRAEIRSDYVDYYDDIIDQAWNIH